MKFSHTDKEGKARMVDVGGKPLQQRTASASGFVRLQPETLKLISENEIKKGDVLSIAEIAGVQAAKKTSDLIPLCHPLLISSVMVKTRLSNEPEKKGVQVTATVTCQGQTGVEMEALTAVSVALLTIYDMCKAVDKEMCIEAVHLTEKIKQ
ncbi:MAG: cyclic pyranopterin monophosphate synthase MoaC [Bacteroidales bacterium]|nr:cyclic pyranopterin monophosphate synthase MoaC [Bacteroidales bacterium]